MTVLAATMDGVYRFPDVPFEDPELVLADVSALELKTFDPVDGVFAATRGGLYRSVDGGDTWDDLGVPVERVSSVTASPDGVVYAGTDPAAVYRSDGVGGTWTELPGFHDVAGRDEWPIENHLTEARVRGLDVPADAPAVVVAAVEPSGLVYSTDGGETWTALHQAIDGDLYLDFDVHDVVTVSADEWLVASRVGVFVTEDGGDSWRRSLTHRRYYREVLLHDGVAYASAAPHAPPWFESEDEGADAELYVSRDGFETWETVEYPGEGESLVISWSALSDGSMLGGANDGRVYRSSDAGETWETVGTVPVAEAATAAFGVTSLAEV
jgi:photosystem II stability/assembly factor-like uncharacterized protein